MIAPRRAPFYQLKRLGDRELPDVKLTTARRQELRQRVTEIAVECDEHELMFLAGALEHEAHSKACGG